MLTSIQNFFKRGKIYEINDLLEIKICMKIVFFVFSCGNFLFYIFTYIEFNLKHLSTRFFFHSTDIKSKKLIFLFTNSLKVIKSSFEHLTFLLCKFLAGPKWQECPLTFMKWRMKRSHHTHFWHLSDGYILIPHSSAEANLYEILILKQRLNIIISNLASGYHDTSTTLHGDLLWFR